MASVSLVFLLIHSFLLSQVLSLLQLKRIIVGWIWTEHEPWYLPNKCLFSLFGIWLAYPFYQINIYLVYCAQIPNWFEGESSGSTKDNPFPLPDVYLAAQHRNVCAHHCVLKIAFSIWFLFLGKWFACVSMKFQMSLITLIKYVIKWNHYVSAQKLSRDQANIEGNTAWRKPEAWIIKCTPCSV